ncbi:hypothetical protein CMI37_08335 [Candidatus Pacearchaeota archaeon]|nr:hypothetical protein [Candidatus Pacearchaeota archaeon]|tara:strand:+ start:1002 stop:1196 length:195 start_codon:yes stop_codon:yes gene_type:complete
MSDCEYLLAYELLDMHYQVWEKDDKEKTIELIMRFINKDQAVDYFSDLGITLLLDPQEANWPDE